MTAVDQAYCQLLHEIEAQGFEDIEQFYAKPEVDDEELERNQPEGIPGTGEAG